MEKKKKYILITAPALLMIVALAMLFRKKGFDTKEEYIAEFANDKEEFEKAVEVARSVKIEDGKTITSLKGKEIKTLGLSNRLIKKYNIKICYIIKNDYDFAVHFDITYTVDGFEYASIYYSENNIMEYTNNEPVYDEEKQMYIEDDYDYDHHALSFTLQTKQIEDHWYYSQEQWFHGL